MLDRGFGSILGSKNDFPEIDREWVWDGRSGRNGPRNGPRTPRDRIFGHFTLILHVFRQMGLYVRNAFFGILAGKMAPRGAGNAMYYC